MICGLEVCYLELDEFRSVVFWCTEGDREHYGSNWERGIPRDDVVEGCFARLQFVRYIESHLGDCAHKNEI